MLNFQRGSNAAPGKPTSCLKKTRHLSLRLKKVHADRSIYAVRITRDYRAVGVQKEESIIWFWIGSHEEYDRLLDRL